ncbi:quinone oxidoreductase [Achromobacter xylosoxidans]|uniref:quinone oxidoreductase family protein n=1 Tax=Alcaligenes xylosoxydans xylosoxydans TaxID=85698 RepID=UPI0012323BE1|nr:quinone oxidoreductase [Achromobacter xylosoxidans]KAA5922668.1 quinone oxidoreductase [Achromobacter xylosoxidans]QKI70198.1 quinone oxidoreductase [Achromobacter xylosoxidans]
MKAILIERYGGPEVLQMRADHPMPDAAPGHVVARVAYAGINFMDVHTRQGKYAASTTYPVRLPCTLGMEGAGEIVAVGAGVTHLAPGDRVAWCIAWGSYAEYASVPAAKVARIPDAIPFDLAAAAIFQGATAHYLVEDIARLGPGSTCLIHAASGSIGQLLVQMAARRGATVFATASSAQKRAVASARGAHHALPYDDGRFADRIREATGGAGVDVVFDAVGKATLRDSLRACRARGLVINYGNVSGSVTDLDPIELGEAGSLFLTRPRLADHMRDGVTVQRRADAVFGALLEGSLDIAIEGRYEMEDVQRIHARLEAREQIGKSVMRIGAAPNA